MHIEQQFYKMVIRKVLVGCLDLLWLLVLTLDVLKQHNCDFVLTFLYFFELALNFQKFVLCLLNCGGSQNF